MSIKGILSVADFLCICIVALLSPWLFGAWEMWWFWPFTAVIFLSLAIFSIRMLLGYTNIGAYPYSGTSFNAPRLISYSLWCHAGFLAYALVLVLMADVFMDAERSFLLFLTPWILAIQILFGLTRNQRRLLFFLMLFNIAGIGIYGIVNHLMFHNEMVLWTPGEAHYQKGGYFRATGSYFCPDHFAGILELAFCMALGLILDRQGGKLRKALAVIVSMTAVWGIVLSKSRGGGLTVLVIILAVLVWGFAQWTIKQRWLMRAAASGLLIIGLALFCLLGGSYTKRFVSYFKVQETGELQQQKMINKIKFKLRSTPRGHMYSGAIRAWKKSPMTGIGPGMHQHLWPHFATSPDGNKANAEWPTYNGSNFHSYEVHSDWIQLLEEYGIIGILLFLPGIFIIFHLLKRSISGHNPNKTLCYERQKDCYPYVLAGLLAVICMGFHSFGDFNLQMPATVWVLACIISIGISFARTDEFKPE